MARVKNQGTVVEIGDRQYVMPPISLGQIERNGDAFTELAEGRLGPTKFAFVVDLVVESLQRNYPEVDRATIANDMNLGNFGVLTAALMNTTDLVRELPPETPVAA